jgi:death on curing protein
VDSPVFLDKQAILDIHEYQISFFGGDPGLSDEGLLDSAYLAPLNFFHYSPVRNLFDLSGCYAFHLVKNHPFVDGNKRVALSAALSFLKANGISVRIKQRLLFKSMLELTTSKINKFEFSEILMNHSPLEFSFIANMYLSEEEREIRRRFLGAQFPKSK